MGPKQGKGRSGAWAVTIVIKNEGQLRDISNPPPPKNSGQRLARTEGQVAANSKWPVNVGSSLQIPCKFSTEQSKFKKSQVKSGLNNFSKILELANFDF